MDFRDNPYESPVIVAELVDAPRAKLPAKKRHPLLAAIFLICDAPFMVFSALLWMAIFGIFGQTESSQNMDGFTWFAAVAFVFVVSAFIWLVAAVCLKELVQSARGR